jgi:hypothetical protein
MVRRWQDVLQLVYPGIDTKTVRQMVEAVSVKKVRSHAHLLLLTFGERAVFTS